ncbi:MAG: prepilin-type N-terminal cleavage/methylation domain-containing protein [Caldisericia bacterium]|jgi:prepilin-type N-terminal cleavage/methylation domain-containing protein|nr:prepilin-type N-terminal cleavage/methylation domain-containing protein [Caldisericia bacterium]
MIRKRLGFTLIELMISIAIFSVILVGIYPIFTQITTFNQENYIRTALIDNLRAGMDRLIRELREATSVELENNLIQDNYIIFSHPNPNSPSGIETVKYELTTSSYSISFFPQGKEIKRYVYNSTTNSWEGGNPVTEPTIYSLKFLRVGQIIKIEIISKVQLRLKKAPQDYIYLANVTVRNPLP